MNEMGEGRSISEILHHMGENHFPEHSVAPPLFQTSIFCFENFEEFQKALQDEKDNYIYSRGNNPTVNLCEKKIAALEHAERAKLVSSGVAAITQASMAFLKEGDHVVCVDSVYGWAHKLFGQYLKRFGVEVTYVEGIRVEQFEEAIRPNTRLIYLESPATFTFTLQPLRPVADLAKKYGIKTIIDNKWSTQIFQNPIDFGIDLVVHSATKYLGGSSDLIGGVICGSKEDIDVIFNQEFMQLGPVPDPFMTWQILRSLRTLHIRMAVHYQNALELGKFLEGRPEVRKVNYPLLPSFPQYELAKKQMRGGSGLFSVELKTTDREQIRKLTNQVKLFKRAVSWGGYESLIEPYIVMFRDDQEVPAERIGLIRLHAGLEEIEELKADLGQALDHMKQ